MTSEFRPTSPADAREVAELCERVLQVPPSSPMFSEPLMQWKYWSAWPCWPRPRSYVLTRGGRVIAHAAVLPLTFQRRGRRFTLLHPVDWASEPTAIGSGASLLKRLATLADGLLIVGGSAATQKMAVPLGFRRLPEVTRYACGIEPSPAPARALPPVASEYTAARLATLDDALPLLESTGDQVIFERSVARLGEALRCPVAQMEYFAVSKRGAVVGGFLLSFVPFQARIAASWASSADQEEWTGVVRCAVDRASSRQGVDEIVCMANDPLEQLALTSNGLEARGSVPMFVLASSEVIAEPARIRFQMLDGDVAFLHHGLPQPWI